MFIRARRKAKVLHPNLRYSGFYCNLMFQQIFFSPSTVPPQTPTVNQKKVSSTFLCWWRRLLEPHLFVFVFLFPVFRQVTQVSWNIESSQVRVNHCKVAWNQSEICLLHWGLLKNNSRVGLWLFTGPITSLCDSVSIS